MDRFIKLIHIWGACRTEEPEFLAQYFAGC